MHFLKGLVILASVAAASAPAAAQTQTAPRTLKQLRAEDEYLKQYEGLQDTSYVLVGYAGDEEDNAPIIMPKEVFAEMLGNMVVMGDLPPDRVTALTRHVLNRTREMARAQAGKLGPLRERRAEIAAQIAALEAPPPLRPQVMARNDGPSSTQSIIARAREAAANSRAVNAGSTNAGFFPRAGTAAPVEQPVDGSIATPPPPPPQFAPSPFTDWMTGTFDNSNGNVITLNRGSGTYVYANGTMTADRIDGTVVEGKWTQSSSGQQCKDGTYHGRYRITFTEDGFSGLFGYCDEPVLAPGGFQGKRRK